MYTAELTSEKNSKIRVKSNHPDYLHDMKNEFAVHVKNYFFMPKFKAGMWDGKTHFISETGLMPYGLLYDFIKKSKELFPDIKIKADEKVRNLFKGHDINIKYDLSLYPRPYQKEAIETCLKFSKGIIRSATASGKSLIISYIIKNLLLSRKTTKVMNCLIVVPSKSLVEQFKSDMIKYGLPENLIGRVYDKPKEWDRHIVISTWQSLSNNHEKLRYFHAIIGDECHGVKAKELKTIFSKANMRYKIGFTGTIPNGIANEYDIKSFLGPILKEYSSGQLSNEGYIAKCNVKMINIKYNDIESTTYNGIKEECFNKQKRLKIIEKLINRIDDNVLLLVSKINEGDRLEKLINRRCKGKEFVFLSGKDNVEIREEWRQKMIDEKNIIIVATYGIMSTGINIPNLKYLILASPTKSKVRTLQSVGRALRLSDNKKEGGAFIYDIVDNVKYLQKHSSIRYEHYESEGFNIQQMDELDFNEFLTKEEFTII